MDLAIQSAKDTEDAMADLPTYERRKILTQIANDIDARKDEFASVLCIEAGKPLKYVVRMVSHGINVR